MSSSDLSARFAAAEIDRLRGRFGRALEDNPDGAAIFAAALEQGMRIGFDAWCAQAGPPASEPEADELWERWQAQRWLAPEGESWPERLARGGDHEAEAIQTAERAAVEAGAELGLTKRRTQKALREVGAQAAEAGASLRCAMDGDAPEPPPEEAVASPDLGVPALDGMVRVISTWTRAECEMLQGMLESAGIRSWWNRSGGDAQYHAGSGAWDIYVPVEAADEARVVLSTVPAQPDGE